MCIDEPARVISVEDDGASATVESRGRTRHVSLVMLALDGESVRPGDWILSNSGIAVRVIGPPEAEERVRMLERAEVSR